MRNSTSSNTAIYVVSDRQDRTNVAGVDALRAHRPLRLRLHARRAWETAAAYLLGSKRLTQPTFPGAMPGLERGCSAESGSQRCWRLSRQLSLAFVPIS